MRMCVLTSTESKLQFTNVKNENAPTAIAMPCEFNQFIQLFKTILMHDAV
jgi:hypothetical protein